MRPCFARAAIVISLMISTTPAMTQTLSEPEKQSAEASQEAAGLPNLAVINKTATEKASAAATVQFQMSRTPSFYYKGHSGTEITEYRTRGKTPEIEVRSNFGTYYFLSVPSDITPTAQHNEMTNQRLPAVRFSY